MKVIQSTEDWEREVVQSEVPVLVDFWAEWCAPCRMLEPIIEECERQFAGRVQVVKLNVDVLPEIADRHRVMSIPTVILFHRGEEVGRITGYQPRGTYLKHVERLLNSVEAR